MESDSILQIFDLYSCSPNLDTAVVPSRASRATMVLPMVALRSPQKEGRGWAQVARKEQGMKCVYASLKWYRSTPRSSRALRPGRTRDSYVRQANAALLI